MKSNTWVDLQGQEFSLAALHSIERQLIERLRRHAASHSSEEYRNFWMKEVADFYAPRGLTRAEIAKTVVYRIAQDIGSRRMVERGEARRPGYRDDLDTLIQSRYPNGCDGSF